MEKIFAIILLALTFISCKTQQTPLVYQPYENLLAVVADLELYFNHDNYRYPAPKDLSGQNIYRASLVRLANFKKTNPGEYPEQIALASARCWFMLGEYKNSSDEYNTCIEYKGALEKTASKELESLEEFKKLLVQPEKETSLQGLIDENKKVIASLLGFAKENINSPMRVPAMIEAERMQTTIIEILKNNRWLLSDPVKMIEDEYAVLLKEHKESKRYYEHVLNNADFYYQLAEEYARHRSPESGMFNVEVFRSYILKATDLYLEVQSADGYDERSLAEKKLDLLVEFSKSTEKKAK